jgi:hypothetical protein
MPIAKTFTKDKRSIFTSTPNTKEKKADVVEMMVFEETEVSERLKLKAEEELEFLKCTGGPQKKSPPIFRPKRIGYFIPRASSLFARHSSSLQKKNIL